MLVFKPKMGLNEITMLVGFLKQMCWMQVFFYTYLGWMSSPCSPCWYVFLEIWVECRYFFGKNLGWISSQCWKVFLKNCCWILLSCWYFFLIIVEYSHYAKRFSWNWFSLLVNCIMCYKMLSQNTRTGDCGEQLHLWQSHVRRNQRNTGLGKSVIIIIIIIIIVVVISIVGWDGIYFGYWCHHRSKDCSKCSKCDHHHHHHRHCRCHQHRYYSQCLLICRQQTPQLRQSFHAKWFML